MTATFRALALMFTLVALPAAAECNYRLSRALLGTRAGYPVWATNADHALSHPAFVERFASFINARFNKVPAKMEEEPVYFVARKVLESGLPWREVFVGRYRVPYKSYPGVEADPNGVGYFTSEGWLRRYAGNEPEGYLLVGANQLLHNTIGHVRIAAANNNAAGVVNTATGRQAPGCVGCHFQGPYALDYVARLLPRRVVSPRGDASFGAPTDGPQQVLNTTVADFRQLVETLVNSEAFSFWSCRLAFEFAFGRPEYACDAELFDRCVDAFNASGKMQDAIKTLVTDPSFCQ